MLTNLLLLIILALTNRAETERKIDSVQPTCLDEDGNPVDWYIAYKFPELNHQPAPFDSGFAYAYITSDSIRGKSPYSWSKPTGDIETKSFGSDPEKAKEGEEHREPTGFLNSFKSFWKKIFGLSDKTKQERHRRSSARASDELYWTLSAKHITDPKSIVLRTLAIAYSRNSSLNSILYNDGPPKDVGVSNHSSQSKAHAKGVVLMDEDSGRSLWLTHSMPRFPPPVSTDLNFEHNSKFFGQTFMCLNFDIKTAGKQVVDHLVNMNPLIYDSTISKKLETLIPDIGNLKPSGKSRRWQRRRKSGTSKLAQTITTREGQELFTFSKSANFGEDIYSDWIDDELGSDLYVASWRRGGGTPLNSSCRHDHHHVNNVLDFKILEQGEKVTWSYLQDHSKWAISDDEKMELVCISDVNRMESQFKRGGGAVCIKCSACWTVFSKTILDLENCPVNKTRGNRRPQAKFND